MTPESELAQAASHLSDDGTEYIWVDALPTSQRTAFYAWLSDRAASGPVVPTMDGRDRISAWPSDYQTWYGGWINRQNRAH